MLGGYGEFMYQTGMIDENQKQYVVQQTDYGVKLIQQQKWVEAFQVRDAEFWKYEMNDNLLYRITVIGQRLSLHYETSINQSVNQIKEHMCFQVFDRLLNGDVDPYPSFYKNATGCTNYFNYMTCQVLRNTGRPNMCLCLTSKSKTSPKDAYKYVIQCG